MQNQFTFGHILHPITIEDQNSSSGLDHLFTIGNDKIQIQQPSKQYIPLSDSDQTPKQDHSKKHKKLKKEKKKRHKRSASESKSRPKKNYDTKELRLSNKSDILDIGEEKKGYLLARYEKQIKKSVGDLTTKFELNTTIGEGLLNIDVIGFPQTQIFHHGLMDKDIPQYQKLPYFHSIIGNKHKKQKDVVSFLNKKINQKMFNPNREEQSRQRYFHFEGYQHSTYQKLPYIRSFSILPSYIPIDHSQTFSQTTAEQRWLKVNRQFNCKLNQTPNNIELWLQFVDLQEINSNLAKNTKNSMAIVQRQISILEKGLQLNPLNERLGIAYLNMLNQKQCDSAVLSEKCLNFIQSHPQSTYLWKMYLFIEIGQFNRYSHELSRKIFEQITQLLRTIIDSTRSAIEVWKLRKVGIQLIKYMIHLYKLQGYGELATGLIMALIDFNFLMPQAIAALSNHQDKVKIFGEYWQNHEAYKLGEIQSKAGWENYLNDSPELKQKEGLSFIGKLSPEHQKSSDPCKQEIQLHSLAWRPSHPIFDKTLINQRPDSYILIEDIDFQLHLYRDTQSLTKLLDVLADHLELPLVFTSSGIYSQFGASLIGKTLFKTMSSGEQLQNEQFYWWRRYWNPLKSSFILDCGRWQKLQYFRRVLWGVRQKLASQAEPINQYLVFISSCVYLSVDLQQKLKVSEREALNQLESLLGEATLNIGSWCIYIEATFLLKKQLQDCINCYLQLLETAKSMQSQQSFSNNILFQILYWMWQFLIAHASHLARPTLRLYLTILDGTTISHFSLDQQLTIHDESRLVRYFNQKMILHLSQENQTNQAKHNIIHQFQLFFIILDCIRLHIFQTIPPSKEPIGNFLLNFLLQCSSYNTSQHFILFILIQNHLITKIQVVTKNLLDICPYLQLVQYWISLDPNPFVSFLSEFKRLKNKKLGLWLACSIFLWKKAENRYGFQEYFYTVAKEVCYEQNFAEHVPQFIILLNKMLLYDVNESHSQFLQFGLKQMPYCKEIYLANLMNSSDKIQRRRITTLIEQKNIRIFHPELLQ